MRRSATPRWEFGPFPSLQFTLAGRRRSVHGFHCAARLLGFFDLFTVQSSPFRPLGAAHADTIGAEACPDLLHLLADDLRRIASRGGSAGIARGIAGEAEGEATLVPAGIAIPARHVITLLNHFEKGAAEHALGLPAIELRKQDRLKRFVRRILRREGDVKIEPAPLE